MNSTEGLDSLAKNITVERSRIDKILWLKYIPERLNFKQLIFLRKNKF